MLVILSNRLIFFRDFVKVLSKVELVLMSCYHAREFEVYVVNVLF